MWVHQQMANKSVNKKRLMVDDGSIWDVSPFAYFRNYNQSEETFCLIGDGRKFFK